MKPSSVSPLPHDGETLRNNQVPRRTQLRAVTAVMRRVPEGRYRDEILAALFAPGRPIRDRGASPNKRWGAARSEWLDKVRAWRIEQGRPCSTTFVPEADQAAYGAETGDYWIPPEED